MNRTQFRTAYFLIKLDGERMMARRKPRRRRKRAKRRTIWYFSVIKRNEYHEKMNENKSVITIRHSISSKFGALAAAAAATVASFYAILGTVLLLLLLFAALLLLLFSELDDLINRNYHVILCVRALMCSVCAANFIQPALKLQTLA